MLFNVPDPEKTTLVKELRKKIEELEDQNRRLAFQNLTSESSLKNITLRAALQAAERELRKVTAERDAAVKDLETAMKMDGDSDEFGLSIFLCEVCSKNSFCEGECNPKWRGITENENEE